eukprot:3934220-Rhodomonas_salina.4
MAYSRTGSLWNGWSSSQDMSWPERPMPSTRNSISTAQCWIHWSVAGILSSCPSHYRILTDIGLTLTKSQQDLISDLESGEPDVGGSFETASQDGLFNNTHSNEVWHVFASQMIEGYEELADINMLEPDPPNSQAAMKNVSL